MPNQIISKKGMDKAGRLLRGQFRKLTEKSIGFRRDAVVRLIGPAVVGIPRWNNEWASLAMGLAQDRHAWPEAFPDAVNAMDADSARAG